MSKDNDKFVLKLNNDRKGEPKTLSEEETLKQMKRGFNNQYISFEYPFLWENIKSDDEDEFTDAVLFNKNNNAIVKISTQPCLVNTVEELKELVEKDLKSKECEIQESGMDTFDKYGIWDVFYTTKEGLEVEQYSILKSNNLYSLELYTKNNRDQVVLKSFVDVIQTFKILKPSYKIDGDSYEKI
ncbi:hypothetical protein SAMN02910297_00815 [Methanobrevibacter olleyae]|uniref:Uncharacterized protein n=1 Tax=Methanobrevibacter olleyae TaxID=294671 RepID=A0A1I4HGD6_METOL|nr:hypothetical protein [Methanobrevibacter olleyae]SFL40820.1 hypothetical protein SAMN02910297_00815 [Methanobrevibacter olleyae]